MRRMARHLAEGLDCPGAPDLKGQVLLILFNEVQEADVAFRDPLPFVQGCLEESRERDLARTLQDSGSGFQDSQDLCLASGRRLRLAIQVRQIHGMHPSPPHRPRGPGA